MPSLSSLKNAILKPEFIYRPGQILRRLRWKKKWMGESGSVELPWGLPLEIDANETIGKAITKIGVYDLIVPEAIFRLCDEGETALDVGANIGMTVGALALAVGEKGKVIAFEPHPALYSGLQKTLSGWRESANVSNIDLRPEALSNEPGTAGLKVPIDFDQNTGVASLADAHFENTSEIQSIEVPVTTLDEVFPNSDDKIGVMKIDIEGHELAALQGAERLLSVGCIRDIIFEEHEELPTDVSRLLEDHGYQVFLLRKDALRPRIIPTPCDRPAMLPNYLATLDPERALARFKKRGFLALKKHCP